MKMFPDRFRMTKGRTFHTILSTLSELGYGVEWKVLNSKDFGVPQSRKRVYLVGYLDRRCAGKYYLSQQQMERLLYKSKQEGKGNGSTTPKD